MLSVYAAKIKPSCLAFRTRFVGLPVFRAANIRRVECSRSATNSCDPSGLPVCVYCDLLPDFRTSPSMISSNESRG